MIYSSRRCDATSLDSYITYTNKPKYTDIFTLIYLHSLILFSHYSHPPTIKYIFTTPNFIS